MGTEDLVAALGEGLRRRLADVAAADERYRSFVFDERKGAPGTGDAPASDAVRDLVLRALGRAADPVNHRILRRTAEGDVTVEELGPLLSLPRIAVSERVNDLLQVGLVARDMEGDRVGLTRAGDALLRLIDEVVEAAG